MGLPGDTIAVDGEVVSINGAKAKLELVRDYVDDQRCHHAFVYDETLPNGSKHQIQTLDHRVGETGSTEKSGSWTVPANQLFMLGDNRDDSADSRYWGGVPLENLEGRAEVIFFSMKATPGPQTEAEPRTEPVWQFWRWPSTVRWERLLTGIH